MKQEDLHLIQVGDEIHFKDIVLTSAGVEPGGIAIAVVTGKIDGAVLIKSGKSGRTVAVQPHRIVAVFRGLNSIYVDI